MAWTKVKTTIVVTAAILLTTGTATIVTMSATGFFGQTTAGSRLRLPVGTATPTIALGRWHGIIIASDGSLWSWGEDLLGWHALGLGNIQTQPCLRRIGNGTDWISVAVEYAHSLAIKSDGSLWCWGENIGGQPGDGSGAELQSTPVPSVPGNDWKQAVVGAANSIALKKDGTLWAWGNNWAGQLGIGRTDQDVREAVQVGSATNWVKIWAGGIQTVGMQADGRLWFWGVNPNPAIPGSGAGASNIFVPTLLSSDTNWVDVGFGYSVAFAIKSDGTLWAWGRQAHIYTDPHDETLDATPVRVGTNTDWQAGSFSGEFYHILRKKDGSLWSLDASEHRRGNKPASSYKPLEFRRIDLHKDLAAFGAMGDSTGVVLTRDGEVWTWGKAFGEYTPVSRALVSLARWVHFPKESRLENVMRAKPWQLPNVDPRDPSTK